MKPIKINFNIGEITARALSFLKARFSAILLLIFFAAVATGAFIFWYYAIGTPRAQPDVEVKIVKIKESDLRKILDDIKSREPAQEDILNKTIPNPFVKPAEAQ